MGIHTPNSYFGGVLSPDDENIEFWSNHFNELVYRLRTEGKIPFDYAENFLSAEKGFLTEKLSSIHGFIPTDYLPRHLKH